MFESPASANHSRGSATYAAFEALAARRTSGGARIVVFALAVTLALLARPGLSQTRTPATGSPAPAPPSRVEALAAGCTPCHQRGVAGIPTLSSQTREALHAKLEGFRDGSLAGTVMPQLARGYTADELDQLAQWFASRPTPR